MTTCFLAPDPLQSTFFLPGGNTPGAGAQVFFYSNKTSTKQTAYKDPLAATAHTNPIVLDSGGNVPSGAEVWFPTGQTFTVKWAPSNDTDPPASPYRTMDDLSGMNDVTTTTSEWNTAPTPSFISASQFTMAGDQTAAGSADVGRRMKFTVTAGSVYGSITARSFGGGVTTVTMAMDGVQVLDAGLSAAFYSILTATNPSVPFFQVPTRQVFTSSSGNYLTPALARAINVRMVGGGGGGASTTNVGSAGSTSTFFTLVASRGLGGQLAGANSGAGGTSSGGDINIAGGSGGSGLANATATFSPSGGMGGSTCFGGGGGSGVVGTGGQNGAPNSGGGGGGAGAIGPGSSGGGGGGGGYVEKLIVSPVSSYTYLVGPGGAGGTSGALGGNGGSGIIIVDEYY